MLFALCASLLVVETASAATATYPDGGSGFSEGAEGWSSGGASCTPAELLCTSEAAYDAGAGNPPGSIAAKTTVTLNLVGFFKGMAEWNSPKFRVPVDAITGAELRLDRAFDPGGLVDVEPEASYVVTLADLTTGASTTVLSEELGEGDEAFAAADAAPAAVVGGHAYRLSIDTETVQGTLALSVLTGTATLGFDNVGLVVHSAGDGGKGGGGDRTHSSSNSSALSDERLLSLVRGDVPVGPAVLKGKRLLIQVGCPAKVGHACRITAQGLLGKHRPATTKRTVRVPKGKGRRIVLGVKPRARGGLGKRRRLLVREQVRAGGARATVYKQRKLIRRG
jgi:hypothetical protein